MICDEDGRDEKHFGIHFGKFLKKEVTEKAGEGKCFLKIHLTYLKLARLALMKACGSSDFQWQKKQTCPMWQHEGTVL